ncbi:hypothetical protein Q3G72_003978 [Acer saccharum]|nr:hypothetical protein Q3G72_003978 [Acer saccharum]
MASGENGQKDKHVLVILQVRKLERACLKNPVKIEASSKYSTVDTLKQQYRFVPAKYKSKRLGALNKFKAGECNILICTDVASKGLDIPSVDMVINYDIPTNSKNYIHRVGRTARAGRSGGAISLVNQYELEWFLQIEKLIGKKLPEFPAEEDEVLLLLERVIEAKRISITTIKESGGNKRRRGDGDNDYNIEKSLGINNNNNKKKQ